MESIIWDRISGLFELDLPDNLQTLPDFVEFIVPKVQPWSEDLHEEKNYVGKRLVELRDADTYHETVLHIFMPASEYLVVIDGDVTKGSWRYVKETNTLIIEYGGKSQLFDLVFLNSSYFILSKHGDQVRKGKQKYYVYVNEGVYNRCKKDWRYTMEELYNIYRSSSRFSVWLFVLLALFAILIVLSVSIF